MGKFIEIEGEGEKWTRDQEQDRCRDLNRDEIEDEERDRDHDGNISWKKRFGTQNPEYQKPSRGRLHLVETPSQHQQTDEKYYSCPNNLFKCPHAARTAPARPDRPYNHNFCFVTTSSPGPGLEDMFYYVYIPNKKEFAESLGNPSERGIERPAPRPLRKTQNYKRI
ncbi:hypothetical protein EVAR_7467_1 [Eumeta japonica]|uniref:Uncharacterized protein n=1 Tax=Eumeta variegata TaxID=151549 RepID=A0A4C2A5I2_EUMVA|nr:hypothetical protein EVAR_7467_1 [Eumeta japonica]